MGRVSAATATPWYRRAEYLRERKPGPSCRWAPSPWVPDRVHRSFRAGYRLPRVCGPRKRRRFPRAAVRYAPLLAPTPVLTGLPVFAQLSVVLLQMLSEQPGTHAFYRVRRPTVAPPSRWHTWIDWLGEWHVLQGGVNTPTLVQSTWGPQINASGITSYNIGLPNVTLGGNLLRVVLSISSSATSIGVTDDQSNSYATGPNNVGANAQALRMYYCSGATGGATQVNITWTTGVTGIAARFDEWYNVAASSANDTAGNATHGSGTTTISAGAMTTTVDGDLIVLDMTDEGGGEPWTINAAAGTGTLLYANGADVLNGGLAGQFQVQGTHGAVTPTMQTSKNVTFIAVTQAFFSAAHGTAPSGIYVRSLHPYAVSDNTTSLTVQIPCGGNCIAVLSHSSPNAMNVSGTDSNGNSYSLATSVESVNGPNNIWSRIHLTVNAVTSANQTITLTWAAATIGLAVAIFDVAGADTVAPQVDTDTDTGNQTVSSSTLTTFSNLNPTAAGQLVLAVGDQDSATCLDASPGNFALSWWTGQDEGGAGGGAGEQFTDDAMLMTAITTGSAQFSVTWTFSAQALVNPGVGNWSAAAIVLTAPPPVSALGGVRANPTSDRVGGALQHPLIGGLF